MTRTILIAAALALGATLPAVPAHAAGAPRTFVSAAGSDTNNCINVATPCRHLATAFAATAADGEIYVLDPANYGSLTITHAVSIEGHGWASIAPLANGNAITIDAIAGDKINIIGVVLDGTALANTNGIVFNTGSSLTVKDTVIRNFTKRGILFAPSGSAATKLLVSNTLVSDNTIVGIHIFPASSASVDAVLDQVESSNSGTGVAATSSGGAINVMVRNSSLINNLDSGVSVTNAGTNLLLTRSTITGNFAGWVASGGAILSYGDNNIDGNGSANTAPSSPLPYK